MWDLAVREDDYRGAAAMVQRMKAPPLSMRVLLTYAGTDTAARRAVFEEARNSDSRQSQIAGRYVATFLENFAAAESLARLDVADRRRPVIRVNAQLFLAWLEVARGRWSAARDAFAQAELMPEALSVSYQRAIAATLPFLAVPREDLQAIRSELAAANPAPPDPNAGLTVRLQPHLRLYLLGLLSSRLGDQTAATNFAGEIERASAPPEARDVVRGLVETVRADIMAQSGRAPELRDSPGAIPLELVSVPLFANVREYTLEHARYLRVLQLTSRGDRVGAIRLMDNGFQGSPLELVYLAPLHRQRAELYEGVGDRAKAIEYYRRFIALWGSCDPALKPRVDAARARLAKLEKESG
jgi:tetratricopeptide (TPR) repeat protein